MSNLKLVIGFIVYGESTAKYLPKFLTSLQEAVDQLDLDLTWLCYNNGPTNFQSNLDELKRWSQIVVLGDGKNIGFARAYNQLIDRARDNGADYFLALNPDLLLDADAVRELLVVLTVNPQISAVSPKVRRWNFDTNERTALIDTCGIIIKPGLQFSDLGQGERDQGQYDSAEIAGPSGCAALWRLSALAQIKDEQGYFDQRIFMYKEDCDLAYRWQQAGLKAVLAPQALIYHDRSAEAEGVSLWRRFINQRRKSKNIRHWSYFAQWLIFFKHWSSLSARDKLMVVYYASLNLTYALIFDRSLLKEIKRAKLITHNS
jgi:GT2 family glycosyltransferase